MRVRIVASGGQHRTAPQGCCSGGVERLTVGTIKNPSSGQTTAAQTWEADSVPP